MKAVVIFHSTNGNCFLLSKEFINNLLELGVEASLYRVMDADLEILKDRMPAIKEYYDEIIKVPIATADVLLDKDIVILGSANYFANVSAEMKAFMDSTCIFTKEAKLAGKVAVSFCSSAAVNSGEEGCLEAMTRFFLHQGMILVPNRFTNLMKNGPVNHTSGPFGDIRPSEKIKSAIKEYSKHIVDAAKGIFNNYTQTL